MKIINKNRFSLVKYSLLCLMGLSFGLSAEAQSKKVVLDISHEDKAIYQSVNPEIFSKYEAIVQAIPDAELIINEDGDLDAGLLDEAAALIILSPLKRDREVRKKDLTPAEIAAVTAYIDRGGRMMLFMDEEHRVDMEAFGANKLIQPYGMELGADLPMFPNIGAASVISEPVKEIYELSYSGSRSLTGGTPISYMNGEDKYVHGAWVETDNGAKVIAFGETMTGLFMGNVEATMQNGMKVIWKGKDDPLFIADLIVWMLD